jgi:gamma-glutamyl-gamma-aminobutyrate hydrolase PuuD
MSNTTMKVFVVGGSVGYSRWLADKITLVDKIEEAELVLFTGGEDVFPGLYQEPKNERTYYGRIIEDFGMPARDYREIMAWQEARALNIPMFGVCRGLQFLTVMNGGKLVQHVDHHTGGDHLLRWIDGTSTTSTSIHHQMCNPFGLPEDEYDVLAVSETKRSNVYLDGFGNDLEMPSEPEVIYYPKTRSLGVQGHPEMMDYNSGLGKKLRDLIHTKLFANNEIQTANKEGLRAE